MRIYDLNNWILKIMCDISRGHLIYNSCFFFSSYKRIFFFCIWRYYFIYRHKNSAVNLLNHKKKNNFVINMYTPWKFSYVEIFFFYTLLVIRFLVNFQSFFDWTLNLVCQSDYGKICLFFLLYSFFLSKQNHWI